ncbi:MAG: glycyl-radical enzyme activating protein [Candidatus Cloacimonetes bacterium]|nr:glycyl-radical enzyme activating protein [Candidatus Cloacimonadota bacterium]
MGKGIIFAIKRFAVHDGPGIRTTIFFKGCALNCWWCHNPEGISPEVECVKKYLTVEGRKFTREEEVGYSISSSELMTEIRKDTVFYQESGGGVTFSGGEPLQQAQFLKELLLQCRQEGIHTCLDTSGHTDGGVIEMMIGSVDLYLYDLKMLDNPDHEKYTGVRNELILKNLVRLAEMGEKVNIRYPVIPGINDNIETIRKVGEYLGRLPGIENIDLLPFHNIARDKYERFGREYRCVNWQSPSAGRLRKISIFLQSMGFRVRIGG